MKGYAALPRSLEPEPYCHMQFSVIPKIPLFRVILVISSLQPKCYIAISALVFSTVDRRLSSTSFITPSCPWLFTDMNSKTPYFFVHFLYFSRRIIFDSCPRSRIWGVSLRRPEMEIRSSWSNYSRLSTQNWNLHS